MNKRIQEYSEARKEALEAFTRDYLTELMHFCEWSISEAARVAKMDRPYLHELLRKHKITQPATFKEAVAKAEERDKAQLLEAYERTGRNASETARMLGLSRNAVYSRLRKAGIHSLRKENAREEPQGGQHSPGSHLGEVVDAGAD